MTKAKAGTRAKSKSRSKTKATFDPICGKIVSIEKAFEEISDGKAYYFCSDTCRNTFISKPRKNSKLVDKNSDKNIDISYGKKTGNKPSAGCCE